MAIFGAPIAHEDHALRACYAALAMQNAVRRYADELRRDLGELRAAEFLYEASLFPEPEYTFKHALTHEVAYGSLLQERRKLLHGRVVDAIEVAYADRLAKHVEQLAHHATRAEAWARAVRYARSAGRKAVTRSAYREALSWFEQALAGLSHLPTDRGALALAVDLHLDARSVLGVLGLRDRALEHLRDAEALAVALGN